MIDFRGVKVAVAERLRDPETLSDIAFVSFRMVPVLALVAAESAAEDIRSGERFSRGTKLSVAGCLSNVALSAVAIAKS